MRVRIIKAARSMSSALYEQCTLVWEVGECRVARKKRGEREGKLMERRN